MDTNKRETEREYEYGYESDEITYMQQQAQIDERILANSQPHKHMRWDDQNKNHHSVDAFWPDEITLNLKPVRDKLERETYPGYAYSQGRTVFLTAYPSAVDYRFTAPGGATKQRVLRSLDLIRTEGYVTDKRRLQLAVPGRLAYQKMLDFRRKQSYQIRNHGFIWIANDHTEMNQIFWFVDEEDPREYRLLKYKNKISWKKR